MPTMLLTTRNRGENPPHIRVTLIQVTETSITENEIYTIQSMSWPNIKIINVMIIKILNSSLGVKSFGSNSKH